MKRLILTLTVALMSVALLAPPADARRLGGGGYSGMKRDLPARTAPNNATPPAQSPTQAPGNPSAAQAVPGAAAAAPAAAAAGRRSWMGPIAGLAAGVGLAALMSHLGLGEELANFLMLALLAVVAIVAIRFLMKRFGRRSAPQGMQFAGAGAGNNRQLPLQPDAAPWSSGGSAAPALPVGDGSSLPADFDKTGFERIAKLIFIRMQAANDAGDLNDLRAFTTPEMFAAARLDLQDRQGAAQKTDVVKLDAEVLDVAQEPTQQVVSVRFHGLIREEIDGTAEPFDEVWHLVKPADGSREWAIAGIAPYV